MVKLFNVMEWLINQELKRLLDHFPQACQCERCILDMTAFALNQLPSHYIVSPQGELYAKAKQFETQAQADLQRVLTQAIEVVTESPPP